MIQADNARENIPNELKEYCITNGIKIEPSPAYAPESNGMAERLVQEHWTRARVIMLATNLPHELWDGELTHANWLRNRLPSSRINFSIPLQKWNPSSRIQFKSFPKFGAAGYAFIYYPKTTKTRKLLPRSELANFLGVEGDERMIRVFVPETKTIRRLRRADFHVSKNSPLPSVSSLLDGIARQRIIKEEQHQQTSNDQPEVEELLQATLASVKLNNSLSTPIPFSLTSRLVPHKTYLGVSDGPELPTSFDSACHSAKWAAAIDREYNDLLRRGTWTYIPSDKNHPPVPFKWIFRAKQIDDIGNEFLYKARCVLRGEIQEAWIDFDPDELYAPVAAHETIRLFLGVSASEDLITEGCDVDNAYLFGNLDIPIRMKQRIKSTLVLARPGHDVLHLKSLYGARQAGRIWGNEIHNEVIRLRFQQSTIDPRLYYFVLHSHFIILCIVVDDIAFASNSPELMKQFKDNMSTTFDVKFYGELKSFIRWTITKSPTAIYVTQSSYAERLLKLFGMFDCNSVLTPLPNNVDLSPRHIHEQPLSSPAHHTYRAIVGVISYLAHFTRPDLTFSISALSRSLQAPCARHLSLSKRLLRYIKGTIHFGLKFPRYIKITTDSLRAAVDAD